MTLELLENRRYMTDRREYKREYNKAYHESHKEEHNARSKAYYQSHKDALKARRKEYNEEHKDQQRAYKKAWDEAHKDECRDYQRNYMKSYIKSDMNSFGQTKESIRLKSRYYLNKHGTKIAGYQIHHCFGYSDPKKFIYCSKEMHLKIHQYLRDNNIDADSDHYGQIKHLLDETVILYGFG